MNLTGFKPDIHLYAQLVTILSKLLLKVNTNTDTGFKENEDNTCYARVDPHMMTIDKM